MTTNLAVELQADAAYAKAELAKRSLTLPDEPPYEKPKLPSNLAEWPDQSLMRLYVQLVRWSDYYNSQLALAEIDEAALASVLAKAQAVALLLHRPERSADSVTLAKAERDLEEEVLKRQAEYDKVHAFRKLVEVLYENSDRDSAVVSRELTRRVGREPRERRADRWTT